MYVCVRAGACWVTVFSVTRNSYFESVTETDRATVYFPLPLKTGKSLCRVIKAFIFIIISR